MSDGVKVFVVRYNDRPHLVLRWQDPVTGKCRCKSAGTARAKEAERAAQKLEQELLKHGPVTNMAWTDFRDYHEEHCLSAMKRKSSDVYAASLNVYERFHKPDRLSDITTGRITAWHTQLRLEGKADATIACYTRHLKATLRWAQEQRLLSTVPKMPKLKRSKAVKVMKGRPITTEEFERMLAAIPKVVGEEATPSWNHYLRGLWWSGLRLGESLLLRWDADEPSALVVDFTGRHPMLRIPAESEKGGQDRILPMAPEFAAFLEETPVRERVGRVFRPAGRRFADPRWQADWVSRVICRIGKMARVVVDQRERRLVADARRSKTKKRDPASDDDGIKRKHASAHDLRKAFAWRWSSRVMPAILQQLMRHEDIETTMRFYVGREAAAVADVLWEAMKSNKSGNIRPARLSAGAKRKPQPLEG
jgi:integrase